MKRNTEFQLWRNNGTAYFTLDTAFQSLALEQYYDGYDGAFAIADVCPQRSACPPQPPTVEPCYRHPRLCTRTFAQVDHTGTLDIILVSGLSMNVIRNGIAQNNQPTQVGVFSPMRRDSYSSKFEFGATAQDAIDVLTADVSDDDGRSSMNSLQSAPLPFFWLSC